MKKVVVIGAGASGCIAALKASETSEVVLLEKNDKICKKLLLTGNGKCNYWHDDIKIDDYYSDDNSILENILSYKDDTYNFLYNIGIYPKIKNGYYYPNSEASFSIKEIFERELIKRNVQIIYNFNVIDILKKDDGFIVKSEDDSIKCDKVILSTGSKAYPKTGSDGFAYDYAEKNNLKLKEVLPSLTGLKANEYYLKEWNGLRVEAIVSLYIDDVFVKEERGEVQLTDYGVSGICIFNLSGIVSRSLFEKKKVDLKINLLPSMDNILDYLSDMSKNNLTIAESLESVFNYKLTNIILNKCSLSKNASYKSLTNEEKSILLDTIYSFPIHIIETSSFDKAQVCTGGISLVNITSKMMVKNIDGLYITGEALNVDGICGGYNLAFAFITGFIAGDSND